MKHVSFPATLVFDVPALALAALVVFYPWLGMGVWDQIIPFLAPAVALCHAPVVWLVRQKSRRANWLAWLSFVCWTVISAAAWTRMPVSLELLVAEAEKEVSEQMECMATRPDYYPEGALIHCQIAEGGDSIWIGYWVRNGPFDRTPLLITRNERF